MTAQVSTNPAKPTDNFMTNYLGKVKGNLKIMIVLFVLHFVSAPLNLINIMVYAGKYEKYKEAIELNPNSSGYPNFNYLYPVIGVLATGIAVLCGVLIALSVFNYYYKKSKVDMVYALPMTGNQRFFSDFLAGATIYLAPYIVSCIITMILNAIGNGLYPEIWGREAFLVDNGEVMTIGITLLYVIVGGFFIMLMTYVLTVLVMTCCGNLFECIAYTILVNILIPATIAVFFFILMGNLYGVRIEQYIISVIERTSPVGAVIGLYEWLGNASREYVYSYSGTDMTAYSPFMAFLSIFGIVFLITAGMLALAWFLDRKRKAEQVSKPFVFKIFYYFMITAVTFCIASLFTMGGDTTNIIPLIIVSAIIYLILELITNRGFKKFYMSVIRYAVTITAVLAVIGLAYVTEGFGIVKHVPSVNSVKSVTLTGFSPLMYYDLNGTFTVTDKESIESIIDVHKSVLEHYDETMKDRIYSNKGTAWLRQIEIEVHESNTFNFQITYNLKNGHSFTRYYEITEAERLSLRNIELTEEYRKQAIEKLRKYMNDNYNLVVVENDGDHNLLSGKKPMTEKDKQIIDEFIAAVEADFFSVTGEDYFEPTGRYICNVGCSYGSFAVTDKTPNLKRFVETYYPYYGSIDSIDNIDGIFARDTVWVLEPEAYGREVDGKTLYAPFGNNYFHSYESKPYIAVDTLTNEQIREIRSVAKPGYVTDEPCYLISSTYYGANVRIIPAEYSYPIDAHFDSATARFEQFKKQYPHYEEGGVFYDSEGDYQYYGPDYDYYDIFLFQYYNNPNKKILYYSRGERNSALEEVPVAGSAIFGDGTAHSFKNFREYYDLVHEYGIPANEDFGAMATVLPAEAVTEE